MHEENKLRVAVVGCGRISQKHFDAFDAHRNQIDLVALCDLDEDQLAAVAQKIGIQKTYNNLDQLLADSEIDVIDICTPSGTHPEIAIKSLQAGKHVVLEKPIALSTRDAASVIDTAEKSGKILLPIMQNRFNSAITLLKENEHRLGSIKYVNASCFWYRPQSYYDDAWHGTRDMDGGVLMNQAIHYVDMICHFINAKPKLVTAFGGTYGHMMESEDVISLSIKFENEIIASLQANTIAYPKNLEGTITLFLKRQQ